MKNIGQFFQENNNRYSATRLAFLSWVFGALIFWGLSSFHEKKIQEIPNSVQVLIGTLMSGKVIQKFGEKDSTTSDVATIGSVEAAREALENGARVTSRSQK